MPEATIRGVILNYRVFGTDGPWIAFTPGSRRGFGELVRSQNEWRTRDIAFCCTTGATAARPRSGSTDRARSTKSGPTIFTISVQAARRHADLGRRLVRRRAAGDAVCAPASGGVCAACCCGA